MARWEMAFALGLLAAGCATAPDRSRLGQDLIAASRRGDANLVARLIRDGADVNAVDAEGWTPYLAASAEGNWKVMRMLKDSGCRTDPGF
jgi:ankyrin repeat protein